MRICLLATNRIVADARALTLAHQLRSAGHTVVAVAPDTGIAELPFQVTWVPWQTPVIRGALGKLVRRMMPAWMVDRRRSNALISAARATGATVFYPTTPGGVGLAVEAAGTTGSVVRPPSFPDAGSRDLAVLAPRHPELARGTGPDPRHHVPAYEAPLPPPPGRHNGRHIVLCYRKTDRSPGRYLEAALRRAGVEVMLITEELDWNTVPDHSAGIVFVESPLPAIAVRGERKPLPVAFWVHHGELHLSTNVRLRRLYGANVVLLAHSWHLAHRFDVPVERFPFAVPTELVEPGRPWADRQFDVAFVGAVRGTYERRRRLVETLETAFGDRAAIRSEVEPEEMAGIYGNARFVINEGGSRHLPITMRVFEATGSGAFLLTDPVPGLDLLLDPNEQYASIEPDIEQQIRRMLVDGETANRAARIAADVGRRHTYDHRVDELLDTLDHTTSHGGWVPGPDPAEHSSIMDIDVQRLVVYGSPGTALGDLRDREVWEAAAVADRLTPGNFEAVVLTALPPAGLDRLLGAARRYIYAAPAAGEAVGAWVAAHRSDASTSVVGGFLRVDLHADAYRIDG